MGGHISFIHCKRVAAVEVFHLGCAVIVVIIVFIPARAVRDASAGESCDERKGVIAAEQLAVVRRTGFLSPALLFLALSALYSSSASS